MRIIVNNLLLPVKSIPAFQAEELTMMHAIVSTQLRMICATDEQVATIGFAYREALPAHRLD